MKKSIHRRSRLKPRPIEVEVDFLVSSNPAASAVETELVFLSKDVESEFVGQKYVALAPSSAAEAGGWTIFKLGKWEESNVKGRRLVISGLGSDFQKRFNGRVLLQSVTPAPLDTVVLKVSEHDYDAVAEDHQSFQQLQTDGIILRTGKTITMSSGIQLEITLCEPVQQGILGEETEVILVTDTDHKENAVNGHGTPLSATSQNDSTSDLDISQFLSLPSSEEDLDYDMSATEVTRLLPPPDDPSTRGIPLRVYVLQRPVDRFSLDPRPTDSEDDEFRVFAHMRDVAHIGVFSGDWVMFFWNGLIADFPTTTKIRIPLRSIVRLNHKQARRNPPSTNTIRKSIPTDTYSSPRYASSNNPTRPSNPSLTNILPSINRKIPRISLHNRLKTIL